MLNHHLEVHEIPLSPWQKRWKRNEGLFYILLSELFGSLMVMSARLLQNGTPEYPSNMDTLQIIFVRFLLTFIFSTSYTWYAKVPEFPYGKPEIRWLMVFRGFAGFWAIFSYYLKYLPISEAVILSFFSPILTAYTCHITLGTPFTTRQFLGGLFCLFGVVIIAQPAAIFSHFSSSSLSPEKGEEQEQGQDATNVPNSKRLISIFLGTTSCIGSAAVFTIIRIISHRAHALISVNYYALISTISSFLLLLFIPSISFSLPSSLREWLLLLSLGIYGFLLQFFITKGLQLESGARGTNMMYIQIVFALILDWGVWGALPGVWSWVGGTVVVGSTIWVALQHTPPEEKQQETTTSSSRPQEIQRNLEEEEGLISNSNSNLNSDDIEDSESHSQSQSHSESSIDSRKCLAMEEGELEEDSGIELDVIKSGGD